MMGRRIPLWQVAAGFAVSALFLALAVRRLDWVTFFNCLSRVSPERLGLAALLTTAAYSLRGWRWRLFFSADEAPGWWMSMRVLLVGYAANNLLPARAGEVVRAHALGRATGLSRTRVLVTVLLERVFDAASLVVLFLVALPLVGRRLPGAGKVAWLGAGIAVLLVGLAIVLQWRRRSRGGVAPGPAWLASRLEAVTHGLEGLGSRAAVASIAVASLVIWSLDTASFWAAMSSFPQVHVPWDAGLAGTVFGNLGTMIPAGPSAVGTFEFAVVAVLRPFGFAPAVALGMAVVVHLLQFVLTTGSGLASGMTLRWEGR